MGKGILSERKYATIHNRNNTNRYPVLLLLSYYKEKDSYLVTILYFVVF